MDFKNAFSKIKKTAVDTASNVAQSAKESSAVIAKKSGELIEISKLNLAINSEESKIKEIYQEMGKRVFEKHINGYYIDPDLVQDCTEISLINEKIKGLKAKIDDIKANSKIDSVEFEEVTSETTEEEDANNNKQE